MRRAAPLAVALLALAPLIAAEESGKKKAESSSAPATTLKRAGQHFVEDAKEVGRSIRDSKMGRTAKGAGREIAHGAVDVGKEFSPVAVKVREATHHFWRDLISTKRKTLEGLRKENRELKSKKAAREAR